MNDGICFLVCASYRRTMTYKNIISGLDVLFIFSSLPSWPTTCVYNCIFPAMCLYACVPPFPSLSEHDDAAIPLTQVSHISPAHLHETEPRIKRIRAPEPDKPNLAPYLGISALSPTLLPIIIFSLLRGLLFLLLLQQQPLPLPLVGLGEPLGHEQAAEPDALDGRVHGQGAEVPPLGAVLVREERLFNGREDAVKGVGGVGVDGEGEEGVLEGYECADEGGDPGDCWVRACK